MDRLKRTDGQTYSEKRQTNEDCVGQRIAREEKRRFALRAKRVFGCNLLLGGFLSCLLCSCEALAANQIKSCTCRRRAGIGILAAVWRGVAASWSSGLTLIYRLDDVTLRPPSRRPSPIGGWWLAPDGQLAWRLLAGIRQFRSSLVTSSSGQAAATDSCSASLLGGQVVVGELNEDNSRG